MPSAQMRTSGLKPEDDWTRVKDPREKKRIQNRVAQRTYRHRMKARLGELQARLDSHEQRQTPHASTDEATAGLPALNAASQHHLTSQVLKDDSSPPDASMMSGLDTQLPVLSTNVYKYSLDGRGSSAHAQHTSGMWDATPRAFSLPPSYGLPSPPMQSDERPAMIPEMMMDCAELSACYNDQASLQMLNAVTAPSPANSMLAATPAATAPMDIGMGQPDLWNTIETAPSVNGSVSATAPISYSSPPAQPIKQEFPPSPIDYTQDSVDDQMQAVLAQAKASGFETFEDLAATYYCQQFNASLSGATPAEDNYSEAGDCDSWDGNGFHGELLKTAERIVGCEGNTKRHDLIAKLSPLINTYDCNGAYDRNVLPRMKQIIQNELPSAWSLAMALGNDSGAAWQTDRSNNALASVLLMNLAGRIPTEKLLQLIGICL